MVINYGEIDMSLVIIPICIVTFFCSFKGLKKFDLEFNEKRKCFICYLDNIKDNETLKRIGEINMFGEREKWYPKYTNVVSYLEKKIDETNDEMYIRYLIDYKKFTKGFLCTVPFMVLSIIIPVYYLVSVIKGIH